MLNLVRADCCKRATGPVRFHSAKGADVKQTDRYFYPAVFTYAPEQEIAVVFPDLDVATSGVDEGDALLSARGLLGITMYGLEQDGAPIPVPSRVSDVPLEANERAVLVDVYMPSVRLASANRAVSRTVTLPAWLNAQAMERGFNFPQVLQEALKEKLQA